MGLPSPCQPALLLRSRTQWISFQRRWTALYRPQLQQGHCDERINTPGHEWAWNRLTQARGRLQKRIFLHSRTRVTSECAIRERWWADTHIRNELRVDWVRCEVNYRTVSPDIEYGVIVIDVDLRQLLCVGKFILDGGILQEVDALFVLKHLYICCQRYGFQMSGYILTSTLPLSTGGLGPLGEAKSMLTCGARM